MPLTSLLGINALPVADETPLLYCETGVFSRHELVNGALRSGYLLSSSGVKSGDIVCISCEDSLGAVLAILGTWAIGAIPAPVSHKLSPKELAFILADSSATVVVIDDQDTRVERDIACLRKTEFEQVGMTNAPLCSPFRWTATGKDQVALIQYTSGSTGHPKGVLHHRSGLQALLQTTGPLYGLSQGDRVLSAAKLSFGYGFGNSILLPWASGAGSCLIERDVDLFSYMEANMQWAPTVLAAVPRLWNGILQADKQGRTIDLSHVRLGISAGEYLPPRIARNVYDRFGVPVFDGLGGTEVLHIVMARRYDEEHSFPLPGISLALHDDHGAILEGPATGRLHVSGGVVAGGYRNRQHETATTFRLGAYTGDICRRSEDGGYEWLARNDDLLLLGGHRMAPREIEEIITSTTPDVVECLVVPWINPEGLQDAVVYAAKTTASDASVVERAVRRTLLSRVQPQRRPRYIRIVDKLPRTSTGKPARASLRTAKSQTSISGLALRILAQAKAPGPRMMVVPCAGGASFTYAPMANTTPDDVILMSADPLDPQPHDFDELVERWLSLIEDTLEPGDLVVGHSFGAAIVLALAHSCSQLVPELHLVLAAPVTSVGLPQSDAELYSWMHARGLIPTEAQTNPSVQRLLTERFRRDAELLPTGWSSAFPSTCDALLVLGEDDPISRIDGVGAMITNKCRQRVQTIPNADHFFLLKETARFFDLMRAVHLVGER